MTLENEGIIPASVTFADDGTATTQQVTDITTGAVTGDSLDLTLSAEGTNSGNIVCSATHDPVAAEYFSLTLVTP